MGMPRRSADETRTLILEAAIHLLLERGVTAGVQHVRLQEVLRSVGLTTGAAYRIWADQDDFHRDLAVAMVGVRFAPPVTSAMIAIQDILAANGPLVEVVRAAALDQVTYSSKFHLEPESRDSHAFITALALRTAAGAWPELRAASAVRHRESIDAFAALYGALLQRYERRMREPMTIVDFTEAMAALGEGFAIRAAEGLNHPMYDVPDGADIPSGEWTLFGISILGMIEGFTVPLEDSTRETSRT
jgi:AcrR family transcriptional regulator